MDLLSLFSNLSRSNANSPSQHIGISIFFSDEDDISLMSKFSTICFTFLKLVTVKSKDMINLL